MIELKNGLKIGSLKSRLKAIRKMISILRWKQMRYDQAANSYRFNCYTEYDIYDLLGPRPR